MKPRFDWIHLQSKVFPRAVVPDLFGTRDQVCGRRFFPWTRAEWTVGSSCQYMGSPATHLLLCSLVWPADQHCSGSGSRLLP